jgi:hypothetical protein
VKYLHILFFSGNLPPPVTLEQLGARILAQERSGSGKVGVKDQMAKTNALFEISLGSLPDNKLKYLVHVLCFVFIRTIVLKKAKIKMKSMI